MSPAAILLAALIADAVIGDPDWLWRRVPHPVVWIGKLIGAADAGLNAPECTARRRRISGIAFVLALVVVMIGLGAVLELALARLGTIGLAIHVAIVAVLLAQRSLIEHVRRVADGLGQGVGNGREAVSMIVGRDTASLDESGVARAALESLGENFSDGVVAPAFWYLVGGLPLLLSYKAINTADSMIGHLTDRHREFGWASAKLDDLVNWPPARLSAVLIAVARPGRFGATAGRTRADAPFHRSPNAGWPEAALANVLGVALGGPRSYGRHRHLEPVLNAGARKTLSTKDVRRGMRAVWIAWSVQLVLVAIIAFAWR